jgi:aromatic-L-amino-acid decarboxylase
MNVTTDDDSRIDVDTILLPHLMARVGEMEEELAVSPTGQRLGGELSAADVGHLFPDAPPAEGQGLRDVFDSFCQSLLPTMNPWNHPGFMAYFGIGATPAALLGAAIMAQLNTNAMLWRTSPGGTAIAEATANWLRQMMTLPDVFKGLFLDSASASVIHAMTAARERATDGRTRREGVGQRRLRVYVSDQTHFSVHKAAITTGIGLENVVVIPSDDEYRMNVWALEQAVTTDIAQGFTPCMVVGTVGTTSTTAVDPLPALARVAEEHGIWLHVDAAYGGMVAVVPEFRHVLAGCEAADSITVNPHKHGFVPLGCSVLFLKQREIMAEIFRQRGKYTVSRPDETVNLMDYTFGTGQPVRALPLWFEIQVEGVRGVIQRLREHMRLGRWLADAIAASGEFELLTPVTFSTICFRARPCGWGEADLRAINEELLQRFNGQRRFAISSTELRGKFALRLTIGNHRTDDKIVRTAWQALRVELRDVIRARAVAASSGDFGSRPPAWSFWARRHRGAAA